MEFYIQELPDGQATLMTRDGLYLFTFRSLALARQACADWYRVHGHVSSVPSRLSDGNVSCSVF
ncbi:MAG TPA: hypothetical protein ENK49_06455 [Gammaproteobacteria bacterium]|nr:hypothetical protein [Gammaproteobacteria bacterium]